MMPCGTQKTGESMSQKQLALAVCTHDAAILSVDGGEYRLTFPMRCVIEAEKATGRSLKTPLDWARLEFKDIQAVLEAGLKTFHAEDAARVSRLVAEGLTPESLVQVQDFLFGIAWPEAMRRYEEAARKAGGMVPNAQSGAAL